MRPVTRLSDVLSERRVVTLLAATNRASNELEITTDAIAAELGCSRTKAYLGLRSLVEAGFAEKTGGRSSCGWFEAYSVTRLGWWITLRLLEEKALEQRAFCCFVVPSLGRESLPGTLDSIAAQDDPDWNAVVVLDGVGPPVWSHPRVHMLMAEREASAGMARNVALDALDNGGGAKWVAFVDDDDAVTPGYVRALRDYSDAETDVVIFTMDHPNLGLVPAPGVHVVARGRVGISFAVSDRFLREQGPRFIREHVDGDQATWRHEDLAFLLLCEARGARIAWDSRVTYVVRPWYERRVPSEPTG